jgi:hypothetical protein
MPPRDVEPTAARVALPETSPAAPGETIPELREILGPAAQMREILGPAEETARAMLEAEEALRLVRRRFEQTEDPELKGELAAAALELVERQLELTRERRRRLDSSEAKLWARQNRLEGFLIQARGSDWWHARRKAARPKTVPTQPL